MHWSCRRSSRRAARRSDLMRREREGSWVFVVAVDEEFRWARFRDWMAWIASVLKMRPLTRGPRLSRGPQRIGLKLLWVWIG